MSSIANPIQLVDAFKKSGEFDRLRKELLADFQRSEDGLASFKSKIADIARQRLSSDQALQFTPPESVHRELMQEVDRYPIVERAAADVPMLSDPSFASGVTTSVQSILYHTKGLKSIDGHTQPSPTSSNHPTQTPNRTQDKGDHPSSNTMALNTLNPSFPTVNTATSTPADVLPAQTESSNANPLSDVGSSSAGAAPVKETIGGTRESDSQSTSVRA